jgi:hypothetical protein
LRNDTLGRIDDDGACAQLETKSAHAAHRRQGTANFALLRGAIHGVDTESHAIADSRGLSLDWRKGRVATMVFVCVRTRGSGNVNFFWIHNPSPETILLKVDALKRHAKSLLVNVLPETAILTLARTADP